jgi:hypothetical protein
MWRNDMKSSKNWRKKMLNRYAARGVWLGHANGSTCPLLVVDDVEDGERWRFVIQLEDWDGRPGISSRLFETEQRLCPAKWLGKAVLVLSGRDKTPRKRTKAGDLYVHKRRPYLMALDDMGRLREHALKGVMILGGYEDGFYDWKLHYFGWQGCYDNFLIFSSDQVDSWINAWTLRKKASD